jgi:hypothetical protein
MKQVSKTSVVWRLFRLPSRGLSIAVFSTLALLGFGGASVSHAQEELLWCSGNRASSPLCVEFSEALEARGRAAIVRDELNSVVDGPWNSNSWADAENSFSEATALFADEFFGKSVTLFDESFSQFTNLKSRLREAIEDRRTVLREVAVTRRFDDALKGLTDLDKWGAGAVASDRDNVLSMIADKDDLERARASLASGATKAAKKALMGLRTDVFSKERKALFDRISSIEADAEFSRLVSLGASSLQDKKYSLAKNYFLKAKGLDPKSVTVLTNLDLIAKLQRSVQIEALQSERARMLSDENFLRALELAEQLEAVDPSVALGEQKEFLRNVIKIEQQLDLLQPQLISLSSSRLRRSVEQLISDFDAVADPQQFGERVNEKFKELKLRYDVLSEKVILILTSDGKSEVRLRPGGKLGSFKEITLKVFPGSYKLSARCPGLREKVESLSIAVEEASITRHVSCL